ncbi:PepSY domain-containing protein [Thermococcus paralvinellae]|uniref:PepSY domain-containing protein n=1 Tax=Thermococcus paralvinellae TaxID=582419 RepID=W0I282_9EURY|nr:PepSY domain-containing protein [Thermococcus paralvinellae]AHF80124.1 Hypothetical protein TES1_0738 [Thermococcus paralvinellae]
MKIWKFNIGKKIVAALAALIVGLGIGAFALAASNTADNETQTGIHSPNYVGSITVPKTADGISEDQEAKLLQSLAKITPEQAKQAALAEVNGNVIKVELDNENGYLVYSVEVKTGDGTIKDVKVDAGNGKILHIDSGIEEETDKELEENNKNKLSNDSNDTDNIQEELEQEEEG